MANLNVVGKTMSANTSMGFKTDLSVVCKQFFFFSGSRYTLSQILQTTYRCDQSLRPAVQPQVYVFFLDSMLEKCSRIRQLSPILSTEVRKALMRGAKVRCRNEAHLLGYFFIICLLLLF